MFSISWVGNATCIYIYISVNYAGFHCRCLMMGNILGLALKLLSAAISRMLLYRNIQRVSNVMHMEIVLYICMYRGVCYMIVFVRPDYTRAVVCGCMRVHP